MAFTANSKSELINAVKAFTDEASNSIVLIAAFIMVAFIACKGKL
jgi:hypothetical protein